MAPAGDRVATNSINCHAGPAFYARNAGKHASAGRRPRARELTGYPSNFHHASNFTIELAWLIDVVRDRRVVAYPVAE
jgi:hypothetical protein